MDEKEQRILEIRERIAELDRQAASKEREIREYEQKNKVLYFGKEGKGYLGRYGTWDPNPLQMQVFNAWENPLYKIFALTGANRISKTSSTIMMMMSMIMGRWPWEPEELTGRLWKLMGWKPPIKIQWTGQDWEKHIGTVLIPSLRELWPESRKVYTKKNNIGVEWYWQDVLTGSTIRIMSNNQESDLFEGSALHICAWDEPPKRDNRIAAARGLIDYNGREIFAMTLLKEAWVDTEVIKRVDDHGNPDRTIFSIDAPIEINAGHGISQEGIDQFAKSLNEEEKLARLKGIPSYRSGLILPIDRKVHFVDRIEIPMDWITDIAIDPHPAKPHHVLFWSTSPNNFKYLTFEIVGHGNDKWLAEEVVRKVSHHNLRINRVIIDPAAKGDRNNPQSFFDTVEEILGRHGMMLETATKDKDQGILELKDMLSTRNGMPQLYIFRDLRVAIRQLEGWIFQEKGENKGIPSKEDDDQCENAYRLALLKTLWYSYDDEESSYSHDTPKQRNKLTGY